MVLIFDCLKYNQSPHIPYHIPIVVAYSLDLSKTTDE